MQCYPIPVPSLNTAQQYAETAGSLAEALHELFLRRPCIRTDPANPGAQAAYYRAVGKWYMENNSIIAAALMACRLLSDGAALELENVREAAECAADAQSCPADSPNAAGYTSFLARYPKPAECAAIHGTRRHGSKSASPRRGAVLSAGPCRSADPTAENHP